MFNWAKVLRDLAGQVEVLCNLIGSGGAASDGTNVSLCVDIWFVVIGYFCQHLLFTMSIHEYCFELSQVVLPHISTISCKRLGAGTWFAYQPKFMKFMQDSSVQHYFTWALFLLFSKSWWCSQWTKSHSYPNTITIVLRLSDVFLHILIIA